MTSTDTAPQKPFLTKWREGQQQCDCFLKRRAHVSERQRKDVYKRSIDSHGPAHGDHAVFPIFQMDNLTTDSGPEASTRSLLYNGCPTLSNRLHQLIWQNRHERQGSPPHYQRINGGPDLHNDDHLGFIENPN